jgi:serine protease Do
MSLTHQQQPAHASTPPPGFARRRPLRTALAAALLAGTALGGYALGHVSPAAEPAQDHAIKPAAPPALIPDFAQLVTRVKPAVVSVTTKLRTAETAGEDMPRLPLPFNLGPNAPGERRAVEARGSGFIVDANGTIVTNNHVVDGAKMPAKVIGRDPRTDVAVLKVNAGHRLPYVELGDSGAVEPGQWVIAIGNPFGLGESVTAGIVSARGRDIGSGPYDNFIQVDAPINKGNSGGPLFTQTGEVIGVTTAILSPTGGSIGIGFAIPSNTVKDVVAQLEANGHVVRGYLGVEAQQVAPSMAEALNLPQAGAGEPPGGRGALIASVQPNSPAERAGLKPGDVIEKVDGKPIATPRDLAVAIASIKPESQASVEVVRNGAAQSFDVTIGTLPNEKVAGARPEEAQGAQPKIGLALQPLTPELRDQLDVPAHTKGAVVAEVTPGTPAEHAGIQPGDVVVGVGEKAVSNPEEVIRAIRDSAQKHHAVALRVVRNGQAVFVALDLGRAGSGSEG